MDLQLTKEEIQLIINVLQQCPYNKVYKLIEKIMQQVNTENK